MLLKYYLEEHNAKKNSRVAETNKNREAHWYKRLPDDLLSLWSTMAKELPYLREIAIPRYYFTFSPTTIQLHGFCDAFEKAYGAVVYIRGLLQGSTCNIKI